jgi:hypothetical protein
VRHTNPTKDTGRTNNSITRFRHRPGQAFQAFQARPSEATQASSHQKSVSPKVWHAGSKSSQIILASSRLQATASTCKYPTYDRASNLNVILFVYLSIIYHLSIELFSRLQKSPGRTDLRCEIHMSSNLVYMVGVERPSTTINNLAKYASDHYQFDVR